MHHMTGFTSQSSAFVIFKPLDIENVEVNETSLTKIKILYRGDTINSLQELHHHSQTNNELLTIPP